ncbi:elongation factor Tu [Streptomyces zagrosensis]|uniref:Elongation factor Tu n=1 Tax=Streptomyces zagrosensis TaxID=1042984 RepID=A0A7W9UZM1_9ACTN|nr:elongation factor Tu [Streptomyces zagrosensis]MBB5937188.1 elongation factor Tu [Streptomyces zagrosensis]
MSRQAYARTKPHLNIGTMGHVGHGKTILTTAMARLLRMRGARTLVPLARSDRATKKVAPGTVVNVAGVEAAHVEYETETRHYAHLDLPGHADSIRHLIIGTAQLDGAILVVSALDGVEPQTVEHLLLARQAGVHHLVVALSKADAGGADLMELIELEIRDLLTAHGYPGDTTPIVRVSGLRALEGDPRWIGAIEALLDAVDTCLPTPVRHLGAPFLLPIAQAVVTTGRGTGVTGTVERGTVRIGDRVQIIGPGIEAMVKGLETFAAPVASAEAGDRVTLLLRGVPRGAIRRGDVVAAPGSLTSRRRFSARIRALSVAEGGPRAPLLTGCRPRFHLRTAEVTGEIDLGEVNMVRPGDTLTLRVELSRATPLQPGLDFAMREGGRTVGVGRVRTVED